MKWEEWLEQNQMNIEFGESSIDLMRRAYLAGLQTAYDALYSDETGDYDCVLWQLKKLIEESAWNSLRTLER